MADKNLLDYIRANRESFSPGFMKEALLRSRYSGAEIDEGLRLILGAEPVPIPRASASTRTRGSAPAVGRKFRTTPDRIFVNAYRMLRDPSGFFARLEPETGIARPLLNVLAWAAVSGFCFAAGLQIASYIGFGLWPSTISVHFLQASMTGALISAVAGAGGALAGAGALWAICRLVCGKASYWANLRVLGLVAAVLPIFALLYATYISLGVDIEDPFPFLISAWLLVSLVPLFLAVRGTAALNAVDEERLWFGVALPVAALVVAAVIAEAPLKLLERIFFPSIFLELLDFGVGPVIFGGALVVLFPVLYSVRNWRTYDGKDASDAPAEPGSVVKDFFVRNAEDVAIEVYAETSKPWLRVSPASRRLEPGRGGIFSVCLLADRLPVGRPSAYVRVRTSTGHEHSIEVRPPT